jgi:hypothetical protein
MGQSATTIDMKMTNLLLAVCSLLIASVGTAETNKETVKPKEKQ